MKNKRGKNSYDLQSMNRRLILNIIRKYENITRIEISKKTGLTQSTITNIVNSLVNDELIIETGAIKTGVGRRSICLSLNTKKKRLLAVRFTRQHILYAIFDIKLNDYEILKYKMDIHEDPNIIMKRVKNKIKELFLKYNSYEFIGIGIAMPGPFTTRKGHIAFSAEFKGWDKIDIAQYLKVSFDMPIFVVHDANAGALCEWWLDSKFLDKGTLVYMAAGQGIGAGVVIDGKVLQGSIGTLGEIGHTSINYNGEICKCGNKGCLELYCSTLRLKKKMVELIKSNKFKTNLNLDSNIDEFFAALKEGDELATETFNYIMDYFSVGIINVINTFNPDILIIGDEMSKAGEMLIDFLEPILKKSLLNEIYENLEIKTSKFRMDSALIGAGSYLLEQIF